MLESYKLYWRNYFNFKDRTPRRGYWWVQLCNVIIGLAVYLVIFLVAGSSLAHIASNPQAVGDLLNGSIGIMIVSIAYMVFTIANIIPGLSLTVRRLHDTGRRWFWILILYVPGFALMLIGILTASGGGLSALSALVGLTLVGGIVEFVCAIVMLVFMCMPTSPNAIGQSTHDYNEWSGAAGGGSIVGVSGMYANVTFPMERFEEVVIGRDAAFSHIVLDRGAEKVSRKHVSVSFDPADGMYTITDFSSNGTYLNNGTRLTPNIAMKLPPGTIFYLVKPENSFRLA